MVRCLGRRTGVSGWAHEAGAAAVGHCVTSVMTSVSESLENREVSHCIMSSPLKCIVRSISDSQSPAEIRTNFLRGNFVDTRLRLADRSDDTVPEVPI